MKKQRSIKTYIYLLIIVIFTITFTTYLTKGIMNGPVLSCSKKVNYNKYDITLNKTITVNFKKQVPNSARIISKYELSSRYDSAAVNELAESLKKENSKYIDAGMQIDVRVEGHTIIMESYSNSNSIVVALGSNNYTYNELKKLYQEDHYKC